MFYHSNSKEGEVEIRYVGEKGGAAVIRDYINKIQSCFKVQTRDQ